MPKTIDAILMASGFSERFTKGNKLLYLYKGKPIARYTLELATSCNIFDKVFFVTADEHITKLADNFNIEIVQNTQPERGMRESIRLGASASTADFLCFFPCDQPLLSAQSLRNITNCKQNGKIIVPCSNGAPTTPTVFSSDFRYDLTSLANGETGRQVIKKYSNSVVHLVCEHPEEFVDIDTMCDLQSML